MLLLQLLFYACLCLAPCDAATQKQVLVAGGAGFIGSHLCDRLLKDGAHVFCVDNLSTGSLKNISHLLSDASFTFVMHDIIEPYDPEVPLDEIYNVACAASPIHYQEKPIETTLTSVVGSNNLLELAKKYNAKIFQASTSEVYGDPLEHPQTESYWGNVNPTGVRSCYDEGKRCAESLFFSYHRMYGVKIKVARLFNTYGPRMHKDDGRAVCNFIVQALEQKPITVYGEGCQTRSFCYIDDTIEAICRFMATSDDVLGPINLGNPSEYKIIDLAKKIIAMTDSASKIAFKPLPSDDPKKRKPDIHRAIEILDWRPQIPLEIGLSKTIAYFAAESL